MFITPKNFYQIQSDFCHRNSKFVQPVSNGLPSFTSLPIFDDIKVLKLDGYRKYTGEKVTFSKLTHGDRKDCEAIYSIEKKWRNAAYTTFFADDFDNKSDADFWAIELNGWQDLEDRIICLAKTSTEKDRQSGKTSLCVRFIESKHKVDKNDSESFSRSRIIKGAGGAMIYSLIKYARLNNIDEIEIKSTNDDFYKNLITSSKNANLSWATEFTIDKSEYCENLKILEKKYGWKQS